MPRAATRRTRVSADYERGLLGGVLGSLLGGLMGGVVSRLSHGALWLIGTLIRRPRDSAGAIVAATAIAAILINSLFLQTGPHPAPIFALRPLPVAAEEPTGAVNAVLPRPRPVEAGLAGPGQANPLPSRLRAEFITDIQRELARRGYYDGAVDGVVGAKTDAAIREFEQAAALKSSGEPSEALLASIVRAQPKTKAGSPQAAARRDPIATILEPTQRMTAIQRALSDFGYGPLVVTGVYGPETRAAVERFERTHNLPITGEISDRVARELTAMTGRLL